MEFDENFASENHGRNSKNSAFQPRSESSLTSGMKSIIQYEKSWLVRNKLSFIYTYIEAFTKVDTQIDDFKNSI